MEMEPGALDLGTIVFTSVGRSNYGFDIFFVHLPSFHFNSTLPLPAERRLTDGISVNFNGQFVGDDETIVYISERTGSARIFLKTSQSLTQLLPSPPESLFHDRPVIGADRRLYFIFAHENPGRLLKSWSALYSRPLDDGEKSAVVRLTPYGSVDLSPAISLSGKLIAVASYGDRPWSGEFHDLQTDIVVFEESNPIKRVLVCSHNGWPTWSGDSTFGLEIF